MTAAPAPVLEISGLELGLRHSERMLLHGVSLSIAPGERVGLVGESGSGKSLLSLSAIGLLPDAIERRAGTITVAGQRLDDRPERDLVSLRGNSMAMIYQNPLSSLNPVMRVGDQIAEAIRIHQPVSKAVASRRAVDLLARVGVSMPERSARAYPHEFSGGMRQRAMIAMAISCEPALLLADEPTTALDVTTQARILDLLLDLSTERGMAVLFVTHNLAVADDFCERIEVMYSGRIVESGPAKTVLGSPRHPYTRALRDSLCTLETDPTKPLFSLGSGASFPTETADELELA